MLPIRWRNRTTNLLIWWSDSPDAWEASVRIRPLGPAGREGRDSMPHLLIFLAFLVLALLATCVLA
jgi:hypothetical protein